MDSRTLAFVGLAAVLTVIPGADVALVTRSALHGGFRTAWLTSLGISLGVAVHATASALGLSAILHTSPTAFTVVKVAGAICLAYLGAQTLRESARPAPSAARTAMAAPEPGGGGDIAPMRAFIITRLGTVFARPRVKQNLERVMGSMLIALGLRLAWARR